MDIAIIGAGNAGKATAAYLLSNIKKSFNYNTDDIHDTSYQVRLVTGDAKKAVSAALCMCRSGKWRGSDDFCCAAFS